MKKLHEFDEIFDGQAVFRALLTAMSNPGHRVSIREQANKINGEYDYFLALAITLLDNEVTFSTCGNGKLSEIIPLLSLSNEVDMENADFIFLETKNQLSAVFAKAKYGTLADPQKSATLIINTELVGGNEMELYGAGIDGTIKLKLSDTISEAIQIRDEQMYEYPQGIDMVFVSSDGEILCVPRLVLVKEVR